MTGAAPLMVGFDAAAAFDPDGYLVEYKWEFGDDNYSDAAAAVNHLYIDPGVYTAKLTVTDDEGNAGFQEIQIMVSEQSYDQNFADSTRVIYPSEINNDAFSFEIGAANETVTGATLRFRALETYTTVIIVNADDNQEVARKYSVGPDVWQEFDLSHVVDAAGTYAIEVLGKALYDVRLLPVTEFEAIELVMKVGNQ